MTIASEDQTIDTGAFQSLHSSSRFGNTFARFSLLYNFLKFFGKWLGFCIEQPNRKISGLICKFMYDYTLVLAYNCLKYVYRGFKYTFQLFFNAFDNKAAFFLLNRPEYWSISCFNWISNIFGSTAIIISFLEIIRKLFQISNNYPNESYLLVKAVLRIIKLICLKSCALIANSTLYCFNVVYYTLKNGDRIDRILNKKKRDYIKSNILN